jgi:hypothetical protein
MQLLMEVLQQASNPQPALQPSLQAAMLHAGLGLDDRQVGQNPLRHATRMRSCHLCPYLCPCCLPCVMRGATMGGAARKNDSVVVFRVLVILWTAGAV